MTRRALHRPAAHGHRGQALGALGCLAMASLCAALVRAVAPTASRETLATGFLLAGLCAAATLLTVRAWWSGDLALHRSSASRPAPVSAVVAGAPSGPSRSAGAGVGTAQPARAGARRSPSAVNRTAGAGAPALAPTTAAPTTVAAQPSEDRLRLSGESAVRSARPMKDRATVPAEPAA